MAITAGLFLRFTPQFLHFCDTFVCEEQICEIHFFVQFSKTIRQGGGYNLLKFDMTSIQFQTKSFLKGKANRQIFERGDYYFLRCSQLYSLRLTTASISKQKVGAGGCTHFLFYLFSVKTTLKAITCF